MPNRIDRTLHDAAQALTVARVRTELARRRLDALAGDGAAISAHLDAVRAALDRIGDELRALRDAADDSGDTAGSGAGSA
jgi:hypothetical protein